MVTEFYDALREIGVSHAQAVKAAEAAATPNRDLAEIRADIASIKTSLIWIQVFLGLDISLVLLLLGKLFVFPNH